MDLKNWGPWTLSDWLKHIHHELKSVTEDASSQPGVSRAQNKVTIAHLLYVRNCGRHFSDKISLIPHSNSGRVHHVHFGEEETDTEWLICLSKVTKLEGSRVGSKSKYG